MKRAFAIVERVIGQAAMVCAIAALLVILVIGAGDVIAQLVARPMPFKLELSEALFALSIFLGWPAVQSGRKHITVDVFSKNYRRPLRRLVTLISDLLALGLFGLITYTIWKLALKSLAMGEISPGYLSFPVYPFKIFCAIGATLTVIVLLIQITRLGDNTSERRGERNDGN